MAFSRKAKKHVRKPKRARRAPPRPKPAPPEQDAPQSGERLQKVLAASGVASRRECEQLIVEGRVEVDRQVVTELGTRVDPQTQEIRVDGEPLPRVKHRYFALNKPTGVVSTARDPAGRPRVIDLLPPNAPRVFTVGRLDISSEGLILLTNDGDLANGLTHPRHGVEKVYHVQVAGQVERDVLRQLQRGMHLAEGFAHAKHVRIKSRGKGSTTLEMVLDEGRNREVRRLLARAGHKVQRLKRVAVGPVRLGDLPSGAIRELSSKEVDALRRAVRQGQQNGANNAGSRPPTAGSKRRAASSTKNKKRDPRTVIGGR